MIQQRVSEETAQVSQPLSENRTECAYKLIRTENRISKEEESEFFILLTRKRYSDGRNEGAPLFNLGRTIRN